MRRTVRGAAGQPIGSSRPYSALSRTTDGITPRRRASESAISAARAAATSDRSSAGSATPRTRTVSTSTSTTRAETGASGRPRAWPRSTARLAQDLVDRFVDAGAVKVFVGPHTGLRGPAGGRPGARPPRQPHPRAAAPRTRREGSCSAAPGSAARSTPTASAIPAARRLLVVGTVHGDEPAGLALTRPLLRVGPPLHAELWIVPNLNPDGLAVGTRGNARGVDLNRDFGRFSQRETRIARRADPAPSPLGERLVPPASGARARLRAERRRRPPLRARSPGSATARSSGRRGPPRAGRTRVSASVRSWSSCRPGRLRPRAAARHVRALLALGG